MLGKRAATAVVLLAILLPAIFAFPPVAWGAVTLAFLAAAAWEWARLLPGARHRAPLAAAAVAAAGALALAHRAGSDWPAWLPVALCAALLAFWALLGPRRLARRDARGGGWPLAAILLLDIAAYFAGRAFGRRKLAPAISPGKTWEGAIAGFAAVAAAGLAAAAVPALANSLPALLVQRTTAAGAVPLLVAIAALSIVGDLHESLLKRQAGAKDSGTLLPGHGGVLDRIDALIPAMPVALLLYQVLR